MTVPDELTLDLDDEVTYRVSELNQAVSETLVRAFPRPVWVRGEVQNLRVSRNGHAYFELVEKDGRRDHVRAVIGVALFRGDRPPVTRAMKDAGVRLSEGVEVRIRGRLDYYPTAGRLQFVMTGIDPVFTVGKLAADRARVLATLAKEGLLGANGALPVPLVPLRIGLVTSGGSAAYHDVLHELRTSPYAFQVAHCDVRIQGAAAERRIVYALRQLADRGLDVVVLVRGGGARSDLVPFDSEHVARAIATMPVPVFTGIGHEIDRTVADEVAHSTFKTPTAAAAALVAAVASYDARLSHLAHRISSRAHLGCRDAAHGVNRLVGRLHARVPLALAREQSSLTMRRRRVAELVHRAVRDEWQRVVVSQTSLCGAARRGLANAQARVDAAGDRLRLLDPYRVLERGYSITRDASGRVVRDAASLTEGDIVTTELAVGRLRSRVVDRGGGRVGTGGHGACEEDGEDET